MSRAIHLFLALMVLASAATAQDRPQGLLWRHSGQAATLPLQVKTDAGADYLLHLREVETGQVVLAAYIRGGAFFRVLAPPGTFEAIFFYGKEWRGEAAMFSPETKRFILDQPLTFGATVTRKNGHLINLTSDAEVIVRDFAICQRLALDPKSLRPAREPAVKRYETPSRHASPPPNFVVRRYNSQSHVCD